MEFKRRIQILLLFLLQLVKHATLQTIGREVRITRVAAETEEVRFTNDRPKGVFTLTLIATII